MKVLVRDFIVTHCMPGAEHIDMNDAGPKSGKRVFQPPQVQAQDKPFHSQFDLFTSAG